MSFQVIGNAATFIPLSFEQQVNESYGAIKGKYISSVYKKLPDGEVVTESIFQISKFSGIKNHEIINKNNFKIIYPGGKWQGILYHVDGSPQFEKGKEVILLLSKTSHGFVPTNLTLGKYEIIKKQGSELIKSSLFPNHPRLGSIKPNDVSDIFTKYFGTPLVPVNHDKFVYKGNVKKERRGKYSNIHSSKRKPASEDYLEEEESENDYGLFGIIILFALLGFFSAYSMKPDRKK
ncbi:MAG: hypothetical protein KC493_07770 [Bacteriovoracaceae bacterium]|nr:hypothetical protein [Bacteriovoracaceae bacterium]